MLETFHRFIVNRHQVWEKRQLGLPSPWTDDPILASRKFTNTFRVLDPGSQFVLTDLLCDSEFEFLSRCLLYRITNLPEAWRAFPGEVDLTNHPQEFREHLHNYKASGGQVFSGAYMVWGGTEKGVNKIDHVTQVLLSAKHGLGDFLMADTQQERFSALASCRGIGDFNAMQVLTDFGYSTEFKENEFVVPGPGAKKGLAVLGMRRVEDVAEQVWQWVEDKPILTLPNGDTRGLSLMDVQNCLCEFSKYHRYLQKPGNLKPYTPAHPGEQPEPIYPKHW